MVRLSSFADAVRAVRRARDVRACAYTLHAGPMVRALEAAARGGARVAVWLAREGYGAGDEAVAAENRRIAARLRAAGAEVHLDGRAHAKLVSAGGALFLDGRNWGARDLVVRDDGADGVAAGKRAALAAEASMLRGAAPQAGVLVESESFGSGNPVYAALDALALRGVPVRLLVSDRVLRHDREERGALRRLARDGADVRACRDSEKFALAGDRAWLGSANATYDRGRAELTDWGAATSDAHLLAAVRARLESNWQRSRALRLV